MSIQINRIIDNFEQILSFNAGDVGYTRLSYSPEDGAARAYFQEIFQDLSLEVLEDGVGNLIALYNPQKSQARPILMGSHIDTVPQGGQFDGLTGVLCGLEVIASMVEDGFRPQRPIGLIIFAEEEGSNFGTTMMGSKFWTGKLSLKDLEDLSNADGKTALDLSQAAGYKPESGKKASKQAIDPAYMFELHVEQGGVLDQADLPIGVVNTIVGMNSLEITLEGASNHAGTTPMGLRRDPLLAAGEIIQAVSQLPARYAPKHGVATVGSIKAEPNAANVICSKVSLTVDIRDTEQVGIDKMTTALYELVENIANKNKCSQEIHLVGSSQPVNLSPQLQSLIAEECTSQQIACKTIPSGAVHDAAILAEEEDIEVGMIFVPSKDGISHSPYEFTKYSDIEKGTLILEACVKKLAQA